MNRHVVSAALVGAALLVSTPAHARVKLPMNLWTRALIRGGYFQVVYGPLDGPLIIVKQSQVTIGRPGFGNVVNTNPTASFVHPPNTAVNHRP